MTTFITRGTRQKQHSLIQVGGVLVKEGSPVRFCTSSRRCCQRTQHVDLSAGPSLPADLFTHNLKYDLQLTSGGGENCASREVAFREGARAIGSQGGVFKKLVALPQSNAAAEHANEEKNSGFARWLECPVAVVDG